MSTLKTIEFATKAHGDQKYGNEPYVVHLAEVVHILVEHGFIDKKFQDSGWLHDTLEDTETTVQALLENFGMEVAAIVICCTGYGKNRKERQAHILSKCADNKDACVVKCADRIANCEAGGKLDMYLKEHEAFAEVIKPNVPEAMWNRLEKALGLVNVVAQCTEES